MLRILIQKIDEGYGNRGTEAFGTIDFINENDEKTLVSSNLYTDEEVQILKDFVIANFTNNPLQLPIDDLGQIVTTRDTIYLQSEAQEVADKVQDISDKVDDILAKLRGANILS